MPFINRLRQQAPVPMNQGIGDMSNMVGGMIGGGGIGPSPNFQSILANMLQQKQQVPPEPLPTPAPSPPATDDMQGLVGQLNPLMNIGTNVGGMMKPAVQPNRVQGSMIPPQNQPPQNRPMPRRPMPVMGRPTGGMRPMNTGIGPSQQMTAPIPRKVQY